MSDLTSKLAQGYQFAANFIISSRKVILYSDWRIYHANLPPVSEEASTLLLHKSKFELKALWSNATSKEGKQCPYLRRFAQQGLNREEFSSLAEDRIEDICASSYRCRVFEDESPEEAFVIKIRQKANTVSLI